MRVDRLTFAKQQPPPPPLGSIQVVCPSKMAVGCRTMYGSSSSHILQCHCFRSPRCHCVVLPSVQDANAAPGAQGPQVIRFERAAAPLGANMAASARAADIVAPSSSAEHLPASGAIADGVSSEPGLPPLGQAQAPGPTHPAQQSSWIEPAATNPVVQPTSAASDAPPECGSELAARLGQQPSRVAAMLALQQAPPPRRPALNQPITPATAPAAVQQHSQMPSQPGPESSSAAPAASASVASPGPPQAMSSPAPQPAPPASTPDWGSSWAAAPGLGIGLTAVQAEAVAAAQQPFSAEVHLPQPNEAAASGEASALGHGAQSLPEATNRGVGTGQPAAALAAAPAPGVQAAAPQTRPSAASPTQLPAQPPQRDKSAWATHEGRRTLRQEARKRRRAQKSNTAPAKPGGCVLRAGSLMEHGAHAIMCTAVQSAWYRVQPQAICGRHEFCQRRGDVHLQRSRPCRAGPPGWMCRQRLPETQQLRSLAPTQQLRTLAPLHLRLAGTWQRRQAATQRQLCKCPRHSRPYRQAVLMRSHRTLRHQPQRRSDSILTCFLGSRPAIPGPPTCKGAVQRPLRCTAHFPSV